ncbi:MAG: DMT family transporter [Burkholderiales bacterium]|nr:DMT family transporter [Burkholderiales bacterium]
MRTRDIVELLVLAAFWGASFLFMRVAAPEFGPVALIFLRVLVATVVLIPVVMSKGELAQVRARWLPLLVVGMLNSALPFTFFAFATLSLTAGFTSVLNATAPLWSAVVAFVWLHAVLPRTRVFGLVLGFVGVAILVWGKIGFKDGGSGLAVVAALGATFCYGIAANFTKEKLAGVSALSITAGSQLAASLVLAPLAYWFWPAHTPSPNAWVACLALGVICTAVAYLLYFRLIAHVGASRAIAVTFLIPLFAILWGGVFLGEQLTINMIVGGLVILAGTALSLGLISLGRLRPA